MTNPRWLAGVLARIHDLASQGKVLFTLKALRELAALDLGLDEQDARQVLATVASADFVERIASTITGEWMYVFKPRLGEIVAYVKVIVRSDCIVMSFHEDQSDQSC